MKEISIQMIDRNVSSSWWKDLIGYFVQVGDGLEIRCWKEECEEIQNATVYGNATEDNYEVSIKGAVSDTFITELLAENPTDKDIYNKMTKYFTINVESERHKFCSAHYGTEMYLMDVSDDDILFVQEVMKPYTEEDFSIHISK